MRHHPPRRTRPALAALALALLVGTAACGDGAPSGDAAGPKDVAGPTDVVGPTDVAGERSEQTSASLPEPVQRVDIDGRDYTFEISPDPGAGLRPGWTLVRFHNGGAEPHQVMFARVKDGVDLAELAAAGAGDSSGAGAIEYVDMLGGVSYIGPDQSTTALVNLDEGLTMAMCYVPDAAGVAHALMGMSAALEVSADAPSAPAEALEGEVQGTIALGPDGYELPAELAAGWYQVVNTDDALHELSLLRLSRPIDDDEARALVDDLAANRTPEVELEAVGGMGAISPGFDGYLHLDLTPGQYLAVDFMPDPGDPRPHMLDGYWTTFTVPSS